MVTSGPVVVQVWIRTEDNRIHTDRHIEVQNEGQEETSMHDEVGPSHAKCGSSVDNDCDTNTAALNPHSLGEKMNETMSTNQKEQNSSLTRHHCLNMEMKKSPEGHSTSSDLGATEEKESFWRAGVSSIYEVQTSHRAKEWLSVVSELTLRLNKGTSPLPPDVSGCDRDSAVKGLLPFQDTETASVDSETEHLTASTEQPSNDNPPTEDSRRDLGNFYDDVPAETLHSQDVDDIYEEIQSPDQRDVKCWSSSEFESYDELSESQTAPPACKHKVQQLMKAASSGTKNGLKRTKLAMFRRVSFLQKKVFTDEGKDNAGYEDVAVCKLKHPPPQLCPMPEGLSNQQVVRRLILSSIVQSERNYLDSLQRILQEYQRPLLEPPRSILNPKKVCQIFYRLQEIYQCHSMFQIALGSRVAEWDRNEKIGDLFVASFSKSMVLNVYSDYINNFTNAMGLIKKACICKPAFLDFLKKKQASSPDRITLYGLMVKPIQRFPQFILLLQDMLKNTPRSHSDRLPLQLALTELETLAEKLNELKRLADQEAEIQQLALSGGDRTCNKLLNSEHKQLIYCELLTEIVYGEKGRVLKSKERKVFLLNDKLICVNVNSRGLPDVNSLVPVSPKYTVKWCVPLLQTQVVEVGQDRAVQGRKHSSSSTGFLGPPRLFEELEELQHDLAVVEEVSVLVGTLSGIYQNLNSTVSQDWCRALQRLIRLKEEEIQNANKCRLSLSVPGKPDRSGHPASVMVVFNTPSPLSKIHWVNWLHLAKIAQRKENNLGWECAEEEKKTKAPLSCPMLICKLPVFSCTTHEMKLQAALHSPSQSCLLGFCTVTTSLPQGYLWVVGGGNSTHGQVEIFSLNRSCPRLIKIVPLGAPALSLNYVKEPCPTTEDREAEKVQSDAQTGNIICVGLQDGSINVYSNMDTTVQCLRTLVNPDGSPVLCLQYFLSFLFAGLANGKVAVYQKSTGETLWDVDPCTFLSLGSEPVCHLLTVEDSVWASCGNQVTIIQGAGLHTQEQLQHSPQSKLNIEKSFKAHPDPGCSVRLMVCSGRGVWMAFNHTSSIHLFHTETLEALQEVNLSARTTHLSPGMVCVSSLLICQGLLWVGTNQGIILTFPAPTLEGIPKITGKAMTSLNAHCGPVDFLMSASSSLASSLLRWDSITKGNKEEADEGGRGGERVENSISPPSQTLPVNGEKPKSVLLQYRLQSTCHLPGKLLTTQPEQDLPRPAPVSPEHSPEDGSIYEVSEDPDVWVRGRPVDWGGGGESRRSRVTSIAIFSGGRGYRRVGQEVLAESCSDSQNTLLVWQLPLTVTDQQVTGLS